MNFAKKIFSLLKKRPYISGAVAIIVLIIIGFFIFSNGKATGETIVVRRSDFKNQVSVSGTVVAAEDADLAFKNGGRISGVYHLVGEEVKAGTLIAKIDNSDAQKSFHDAEIALASAKLSLSKTQLDNSNENLNTNLAKAYDDGFTDVSAAFLDLSTVISGLDDLLNGSNVSDNAVRNSGATAVGYKDNAVKLYYEAKDSFDANRNIFRTLDRNSAKTDIENIINKTYDTVKIFSDATKSAKNLVDYMSDDTNRPADFTASKSTLSTYTAEIDGHLSTLLSVKTSIRNYRDDFSNASLDIQSAELSVKQKEVALSDARNNLENYYIRAPFDGIVTKVDAKMGEVATANVSLVSMMSNGTFEIESYVPEVNISKITVGNEAEVTLDAYGDAVLFNAKVISVDPAETVRDGVSTYKIKLQFSAVDERIKSGMTANVSITTWSKPNAIVVPGGVVFDKNGKKFVQVKNGDKISDREVTIGGVSSLGQTEIISGLEEGEMILLNPK